MRRADLKRGDESNYHGLCLCPDFEGEADYYSDLQSILVYPDSYVAPVSDMDEGGIVSEGFEPRSGEYWGTGNIVLAWSEIKKNLSGSRKAQNLIYHEFSHLLDDRYGLTAGITLEGKALREDEWTRVLASSYKKHGRNMNESRRSILDEYGTRSPAEFFSVASEAFFEAPDALHREMPDLYRVLRSFYALDPFSWRDKQFHQHYMLKSFNKQRMRNTDILKSLRYILDINEAEMAEILKLAGYKPNRKEIADIFEEDDEDSPDTTHELTAYFLDGVIYYKRGKSDKHPPQPFVIRLRIIWF